MFLRFTLSLAALLVFRLSAQQLGSVQGRVVDSVQGAVVPNARLVLACMITKRTGAPCGERPGTVTADGSFRFENVEPGIYLLVSDAPGYLPRQNRPTPVVEVKSNETTFETTVPLIPASTVSGIVTDPNGQPVGGAKVALIKERFFNRRLALTIATSATTNNKGVFLFTNLVPGRYYASAESPANIQFFSPGVLRIADASVIGVPEGQSVSGITIQLGTTEGQTISGKITGLADMGDLKTYKIRLLSDNAGLFSQVATLGPNGEFAFPHVAAGDYRLRLVHTWGDAKQPGATFARIVADQTLAVGAQSIVTWC